MSAGVLAGLQNRVGVLIPSWVGSIPTYSRQIEKALGPFFVFKAEKIFYDYNNSDKIQRASKRKDGDCPK